MERILNALGSDRAKRVRVRFALGMLIASLIGWPLSAFTWAREEPQFILGLSWVAITLTAWDILTTAQVHEESGTQD